MEDSKAGEGHQPKASKRTSLPVRLPSLSRESLPKRECPAVLKPEQSALQAEGLRGCVAKLHRERPMPRLHLPRRCAPAEEKKGCCKVFPQSTTTDCLLVLGESLAHPPPKNTLQLEKVKVFPPKTRGPLGKLPGPCPGLCAVLGEAFETKGPGGAAQVEAVL